MGGDITKFCDCREKKQIITSEEVRKKCNKILINNIFFLIILEKNINYIYRILIEIIFHQEIYKKLKKHIENI